MFDDDESWPAPPGPITSEALNPVVKSPPPEVRPKPGRGQKAPLEKKLSGGVEVPFKEADKLAVKKSTSSETESGNSKMMKLNAACLETAR